MFFEIHKKGFKRIKVKQKVGVKNMQIETKQLMAKG
jgi:hypothetical protein